MKKEYRTYSRPQFINIKVGVKHEGHSRSIMLREWFAGQSTARMDVKCFCHTCSKYILFELL